MAPFAGYEMPIEFTGINAEHAAVREHAGLFDVSHMGEIWVKGPDALAFLQRVTTNDVSKLYDGKIQYSCLTNENGGIVDDLLVYKVDDAAYLLVVNASNTQKDWEHLCRYAPEFGLTPGKELYNASGEIAQIALQGPDAMRIVQKLTTEPVTDMEYYTFRKMDVAGVKDAIVSATGYTGSGGCEIYVANEDAGRLWKAVWEAGEEFGLKPIGLGARDTLRLEMGFSLYGNDLSDETTPIEAGLGWITKFVPGKDFVGRAILEKQKAEGPARKLVGFEMVERGIPRHGYLIADESGSTIGEVTSGTMAPSMKKGIGMGYVASENAKPGAAINIIIRNKPVKAVVVKPPFYK